MRKSDACSSTSADVRSLGELVDERFELVAAQRTDRADGSACDPRATRDGRSARRNRVYCCALLVVNTTKPSAVGSTEGISIERPVPVIGGHPKNDAYTDGTIAMVAATQSSIATSMTSPSPPTPNVVQRGQRGQRRVGTGHPFADPSAGSQRLLVGEPAEPGRTSGRLQRELGRGSVGPWPVEPERRDRQTTTWPGLGRLGRTIDEHDVGVHAVCIRLCYFGLRSRAGTRTTAPTRRPPNGSPSASTTRVTVAPASARTLPQ